MPSIVLTAKEIEHLHRDAGVQVRIELFHGPVFMLSIAINRAEPARAIVIMEHNCILSW